MEAVEKVDVSSFLEEAEKAVSQQDSKALSDLVDRLEKQRRGYLEQAQTEAQAARQAEQELSNMRGQLAYVDPAESRQRYADMYFAADLHADRARACQAQAEEVGKILTGLRRQMETILARQKAVELVAEAQKVKRELEKAKARTLPLLREGVERAQGIVSAVSAFNQTTQTAKLPVPVLRCEDPGKLMRTLHELDLDCSLLGQMVEPAPDGQKRVLLKTTWRGYGPGRVVELPLAAAEEALALGVAEVA